MIKSMTGFGRGECNLEGQKLTVEVRSLNHRFLEISVHASRQCLAWEQRFRKMIQGRFARGRFDIHLKHGLKQTASSKVSVNLPLVQSYVESLMKMKKSSRVKGEIDLYMLAGMKDVLTIEEPDGVGEEKDWAKVQETFQQALDSVETMRVTEGKTMYEDLSKRIQFLDYCLVGVQAQVPEVVEGHQKRLTERVQEILENVKELDQSRVDQEIAFIVQKIDVTEEVVRARSHLAQLKNLLDTPEPVGRKLDFLVQELQREINTMGSKGNDSEVSQMVVEGKAELEKIREQIQNVE